MEISGIVKSEVEGTITDFGYVSPKEDLKLTDRQLRMIEKKRKLPIGQIQMPLGTTLTIVLEDTSKEVE